jgi:hypothetical protein
MLAAIMAQRGSSRKLAVFNSSTCSSEGRVDARVFEERIAAMIDARACLAFGPRQLAKK